MQIDKNEIKEIASDYNISVKTINELLNIYNCLESITILLDKLIIKDLHKRELI